MCQEHFPGVPKIAFEGPKSKNPFAFKHYNPDELVEGRSMREHLRFAAAYWHVMPPWEPPSKRFLKQPAFLWANSPPAAARSNQTAFWSQSARIFTTPF